MTNDLAIRILTGDVLGTTEQTKEAVTMAVRALSKPNVTDTNVGDTISRQAAIDAVDSETVSTNPEHFESSEKFIKFMDDDDIASFGKWQWANGFNTALVATKVQLERLPSAQPEKRTEKRTETHACDLIDREAAVDAIYHHLPSVSRTRARTMLHEVPSAQPEQHTCVNCGRTVNNGGWYADGRTRCPIEEHYALPKDGFCHLWEKRNVTDDDYPERREE